MSYVTGNALGTKLCEALGIDTKAVHSLTIKCTVGEAATVEVVTFVRSDNEFVEMLQTYRLSPIDESS